MDNTEPLAIFKDLTQRTQGHKGAEKNNLNRLSYAFLSDLCALRGKKLGSCYSDEK